MGTPTVPANPLFALVGGSGVGKSTLLLHLPNVWPLRRKPLGRVRSLTDRLRRPKDPAEDAAYEFTSRQNILRRRRQNALADFVDSAGVVYALEWAEARRVLSEGPGVMALTRQGVANCRASGLHVVPIRIVPVNRPARLVPRDPARLAADAAQAAIPMDFWHEIKHDFESGGRSRGLAELNDVCFRYVSR